MTRPQHPNCPRFAGQASSARLATRRTTTDGRHAGRIDRIRSAAIVHERLGQAAQYCLVEGRHEISIFGRTAGRLRSFVGDNLADAIGRAELEGDL